MNGEQDEADTRAALDIALRAHAMNAIDPSGEVIVTWLALAATRRYDGGGAVIHMPADEAMPFWEARGILGEALAAIDRLATEEAGGS